MPKINIVQRDFTTPAQIVNNENIVLVPVWSWKFKGEAKFPTEENPILLRTYDDLKNIDIGQDKKTETKEKIINKIVDKKIFKLVRCLWITIF